MDAAVALTSPLESPRQSEQRVCRACASGEGGSRAESDLGGTGAGVCRQEAQTSATRSLPPPQAVDVPLTPTALFGSREPQTGRKLRCDTRVRFGSTPSF